MAGTARGKLNLAEHGMKFYYHNHGYEFYPHGSETLFDLLVAETDPQTVYFQMDVFRPTDFCGSTIGVRKLCV